MRLPLSWLKKYIAVPWPAEKIADALTMSGTKVERVQRDSGEPVIEIEVTTNRPDCLSILGLAKEVSVLSGKKIKYPKVRTGSSGAGMSGRLPDIVIEDRKGCPRYTGRLIEAVTIRPAPDEIQKCLERMGARPINQAVDATNFVLFEMGQPLHAFDYDKLAGNKIIVRRAKDGEKFLGIDGIEYTLDTQTLVIADAEKPVAIAGVIGGKLTEITDRTKNVLLESAYFDPALVRQALRKYKVSTDSSYRFERGVNPENVALASSRATDLIVEWGGGHAGRLVDKGSYRSGKPGQILLSVSQVDAMIGMKIGPSRITSVLKNLGFEVKLQSKDRLLVRTSSARRDIALAADLIEEILRIEGFNKVPAVIPTTHHTDTLSIDTKVNEIYGLKKFLSALGFSEIITYSLIPERFLMMSTFTDLSGAQKISNALSADQEYLRPMLLPRMLQSIQYNVHRKAASLKLFEIGNRYVKECEETTLALALYGQLEEHWKRKEQVSFYDLKGMAENILSFLKIKDYEWQSNEPCMKYENSISLKMDGKKVGTMGVVSLAVQKNWDIPHPVIYGEFPLEYIFKKSSQQRAVRVKALPKYPLVRRDVAFVVDEKIAVSALERSMKEAAQPYLKEARLFDEYAGKNIASGKRSLAFSLAYQKETGTFTDQEINTLQSKVGEALKNAYRVEFR